MAGRAWRSATRTRAPGSSNAVRARTDETGRGLLLLDAVALDWGVEQGPGGKTVWCECAL
ncbi:hypothetical protein GCM10010307_14330 [Streptomyces vastus]|uniref:ATP-binding protein n=1 Tax=Streptomyces vastus TaxID=285451 RepID=A0ABP6CWW7_9ACTN